MILNWFVVVFSKLGDIKTLQVGDKILVKYTYLMLF